MPRGVTDQFLKILRNERKASRRTAVAVLALVPIAYFMAELTDRPRFGFVVLLVFAALLAGFGAGLAWRRRTTQRYNESLRASWNAWMRMSLSCARVDEVARQVAEKPRLPALAGAAWGSLLVANALLFALLWAEWAPAVALGAALAVVNGGLLGFLAGEALWSLRWAQQFGRALDDLIAQGQVGLWGEV